VGEAQPYVAPGLAPPIRRADLEYPTEDVSFAYLAIIDKLQTARYYSLAYACTITLDSFTDKRIFGGLIVDGMNHVARMTGDLGDAYNQQLCTGDGLHKINKCIGGTLYTIASEPMTLSSLDYAKDCYLSVSGSTLSAVAPDVSATGISATDTDIASGCFGWYEYQGRDAQYFVERLEAPATPLEAPDCAVVVELVGEGKLDGKGPRPNLPLDRVTYSAFECKGERVLAFVRLQKTNIDEIKKYGRIIKIPKDYHKAIEQYEILRKEFTEWIAGKENYCYQCGFNVEPLACADFYYGELVEHKTHYKQLKKVPDWGLERAIKRWRDLHKHAKAPKEEIEKHVEKLDELLRKGW